MTDGHDAYEFPADTESRVAIVGIGCRFPGDADDPGAFWTLLRNGVDAITVTPTDRWNRAAFHDSNPAAAGRSISEHGGFLRRIDQFDEQFFGMSPREAARADPQQRLLLEVAFEALEDAGQTAAHLRGVDVGVFVGISSYDYGGLQTGPAERALIDAYTNAGGALSIAANRISYVFDLTGPSLAVDTACSSSLVAVHLACRSMSTGECGMALAAGVNLVIRPETTIGFSKAGMLAPDGRCKSFDARANGYVRAEGAGVVVLKPFAAAVRDGDRIYAVIRGTAVNQDGRTTGLSVPNGEAQARMLSDACRRAGVRPQDILYVEAHGTGTPVGDPIEATAIGRVLGAGRMPGRECLVGSVKTNIGHLEAASGLAGLIKTALCLYHREIPANLHFQDPNPQIPFESLGLRVPTTLMPWPANGAAPALAAVNSFGFGGTNAHAILEAAPPPVPRDAERPAEETSVLVPISARTADALRARARTLADWVASDAGRGWALVDIASELASRRWSHQCRLPVVARSAADLRTQLEDLLGDDAKFTAAWRRTRAGGDDPRVAFVFAGMGTQWWAMGRELSAEEPIYRRALERCDASLRRHVPWSLIDELSADLSSSRIHRTEIAQPALFALQVALGELWRAWGVTPSAVLGHSVGEVAAAYAAGVLDLDDAVTVVFHRSRLQQRTAGQGSMLAVGAGLEQVAGLLQMCRDAVSVAAINSPTSLTLSGDVASLQHIAERLRERGTFHRFLQVEVPYHSPLMDPLRAELLTSLASLRPRASAVDLFSTVTGALIDGSRMTGDYWWSNVRTCVAFGDAVRAALDRGFDVFLEVGAHPVLHGPLMECASAARKSIVAVPSLKRQAAERASMLRSLGTLDALGLPVHWPAVNRVRSPRRVPLPAYPWQRARHWCESQESALRRVADPVHPLLGRRSDSPLPSWVADLQSSRVAYLLDHRFEGAALFPAAAYVEAAVAAVTASSGAAGCALEAVEFKKALWIRDAHQTLQFAVDTAHSSFEVFSSSDAAGAPWVRHACGQMSACEGRPPGEIETPDRIRARLAADRSADDCYQSFRAIGLEYGPHFRTVERLWFGEAEALARVRLDPRHERLDGYQWDPRILDGCFQTLLGAMLPRSGERTHSYLPVAIDRIRIYAPAPAQVWSHARIGRADAGLLRGDLRVFDDAGRLLAEIRGLHCQRLPRRAGPAAPAERTLYRYEWTAERTTRPGPFLSASSHATIVEEVREAAVSLGSQPSRRRHYRDVRPQLDGLVAQYVTRALQELGWTAPRQAAPLEQVAHDLGIQPAYRRLLERYLEIARGEAGRSAQPRRGTRPPRVRLAEIQRRWRAALDKYPAYLAELTLIERCGRRLPDVLRGDCEALELFFPRTGATTLEHFYQDSPTIRAYNLLAQQALRATMRARPPGPPVRILEIGAGTGGTTTYLLPVLSASSTEYVYTDVSAQFGAAAQSKFARYPFVTYRTLDIQSDPAEQGFERGSFDVVIACDVLHATRDLRVALRGVRSLLAPGGAMLLLELTAPPLWIDALFGLLSGWWNFSDTDLRPDRCLLTWPQWRDLLAEHGFDAAAVEDVPGESEHSVIIGRADVASRSGPSVSPAVAAPEQPGTPGDWLVLLDDAGFGERVTERLGARGERVHGIRGPVPPPDLSQLPPVRGIVVLWALDVAEASSGTAQSLLDEQERLLLAVLELVRAVTEQTARALPALWLVTRRSQPVGRLDGDLAVEQAPLWGLARVIRNEHLRWPVRVIDLGGTSDADADDFCRELLEGDGEDEIAWRDSVRYVHRLRHMSLASAPATNGESAAQAARPFRLEIDTPGILDTLRFQAVPRRTPPPGAVEIEVVTAALNFKDVAKAMGLLSHATLALGASETALGLECAGLVSAVGDGVRRFAVGDAVIAFAPRSLGSHVVTDSRFVLRKPEHLTFEEAATATLAFVTAHYALNRLARLGAGERVLVHAGAGGVGLAAIQLARRAGGEVFATAGTAEKRDFLRALGVAHVFDSRSLGFVDDVMAVTDGGGIDVVLNSLSGEAIRGGLSLLRTGGRFVELGKRDIDENAKVGLKAFQNGIALFAVDLDRLCLLRPDVAATLFQEAAALLESRRIHPLPYRLLPPTETPVAFRAMAQGRHTGKMLISLSDPSAPIAIRPDVASMRSDGTYLVTGGLGGFGRAVAQWLVERGARHVMLVGRNGASSPAAERAVERMRRAGADVRVVRADVSDPAQIDGLFRSGAPPLRGVIHAAMVLDDAVAGRLTREQLRRVMAPKIAGAWNLHVRTREMPLDFFVMFSSFASLVGNPGQASYAAANAFLDALAHHRTRNHLPALAVNWGPVADAGYVSENDGVADRLARLGVETMPVHLLLDLLGRLLQGDTPQCGVLSIDWGKWAGSSHADVPPRLASVVDAGSSAAADVRRDAGEDVRAAIRCADPATRGQLVEQFVRAQVARVSGIAAESLDAHAPLTQFGVDSLMAMEVSSRLQGELLVDVPAVKFLAGLTVSTLVDCIVEELSRPSPSQPGTAPGAGRPADDPAGNDDIGASIAELSDAEVDRLLGRLAREPAQPPVAAVVHPGPEPSVGRDARVPEVEQR